MEITNNICKLHNLFFDLLATVRGCRVQQTRLIKGKYPWLGAGRAPRGRVRTNCPCPRRAQLLATKQPHYFATHQPEWSNQPPDRVRSGTLDIQMRIRPQLWKLTDGSEVTVR